MKQPIMIVAGIVVLVVGGIFVSAQLNKDSDTDKMHSGGSSNTASADKSAVTDLSAQTEVAINIQDFAYEKANLKIKVGTTVTWTNQDDARHNVVTEGEGAEKLASELLAKGESYSFTFTKAGTTTYLCEPHPYMKGTINVVE